MNRNIVEQFNKDSLINIIKNAGSDIMNPDSSKPTEKLQSIENNSIINIYSRFDEEFKLNTYKNSIFINLNNLDTNITIDMVDNDTLTDKHIFMKAIPCFTHGIIRVKGTNDAYENLMNLNMVNTHDANIKFVTQKFYYNIDKLNISDKKSEFELSVISDSRYDGIKNPNTTIPFIVRCTLIKNNDGSNKFNIKLSFDSKKFFQMVDIIKKYDISKSLIQETFRFAKLLKDEEVRSSFTTGIAKAFIMPTIWSNELMENKKADIGDTKHEKKHTEIFIFNQLDNKKCSTKVIEGNGITIKCVNKSELTSKKYGIVTYKTPSWPVRGYLRHLKSGKVVYVKECVRVRKALKDKATLKDQQYQKIIIK